MMGNNTAKQAFLVPDTGVEEQGTPVERGSKRYVNVAELLANGLPDPPQPIVLTRSDGNALLYAEQVNLLFGDPESGKTFLALAAISEVAKARRRSVFIDIDHNGATSIIARLLALGVSEEYLGDESVFRYVEPEDRGDLSDIIAFLKTWRPAVAIVDSVGELLPLMGGKSNDPDEYTAVFGGALKPLAQAGAAVIAIDHLAKNSESRAAGPTGTAAKRRAVGGTSIRVKVNDQFAPGHGGSAWLTVNKDRHGGLREHCPRGDREPSAGLFTIEPDGDQLRWNIRAPKDGDAAQISGVSESDLASLDQLDPPPSSVRDVKDRMRWGTGRASEVWRIWRTRSPGTGQEQGTAPVPRSSTPVSGTRNAPEKPSGSSVDSPTNDDAPVSEVAVLPSGDSGGCADPSCPHQARNGCRTCWGHASDEHRYRKEAS